MHRIKAWVRSFFGFSRRETNAFIVLLPLMVVILFSEPVYRHMTTGAAALRDHSKEDHELDSLLATLSFIKTDSAGTTKKSTAPSPAFRPVPFYPFDPNTIAPEDFIALGLSPYVAGRIVRYRQKGGKFKRKEDLKRIYGIDTAWYKKAIPWISITATPSPLSPRSPEKRITVVETVDINSADSTQLMKVYGIGPALSKRICMFRERLGGFISMEQLEEVYGLDTAVVKSLKKKFFVTERFLPQQININVMKTEEVRHPYLKRKEVMAIVAFRTQHGNFQSLEQLGDIKILSKEWIDKVRPYLKVD